VGLTITLPVPPTANLYWRHVGQRVLLSREARAYKHHAALVAASAGMRPLDGPVVVTLVWYRAARRGDLDNRAKVAIDALIGVGFTDDSNVVELHAYRYEDKHNPRMEVTVRPFAGGPAAPERSDR
jgi:Holliday junction resolvase RusA-like endonuclease